MVSGGWFKVAEFGLLGIFISTRLVMNLYCDGLYFHLNPTGTELKNCLCEIYKTVTFVDWHKPSNCIIKENKKLLLNEYELVKQKGKQTRSIYGWIWEVLRNYHVEAYLGHAPTQVPKYWLMFSVSVSPFGLTSYTISTSNKTGTMCANIY